MKTLVAIVIVGVAAYFVFRSPVAVPTPDQAEHKQPRLAPPGTYFVLRYESFATEHGLAAFVPGQEVRAVPGAPPSPGRLTVTDGRFTRTMDAHALTNDAALAASLRQNDEQAQAAIQAKQAADLQQAKARERAAVIAAANDLHAASQRAAQARELAASRLSIPTPTPPPPPVIRGGAHDAYGRPLPVRGGNGRPSASPSR